MQMVLLQSKAYQKSKFICDKKQQAIAAAFATVKAAAEKTHAETAETLEQAKTIEKVDCIWCKRALGSVMAADVREEVQGGHAAPDHSRDHQGGFCRF